MKKSAVNILARVALVAATMMWGSMFVVSKNAMETVPVFFMTASRYTAAAIMLSVVFRKRLKGNLVRTLKPGIVIGLLVVLGSLLQMIGLKYSSPGKTAFLTVVYCVLVPFVHWAVDKKRPSPWHVGAALLCLCGIGLISLGDDFSIGLGDVLVLGCGLVFAVHIVMLGVYVKDYDPVVLTIFQFLIGGIVSWVLHFFTHSGPIFFTADTLANLLYIAIFPTCVAMLFQSFAQQHINPSTVGIILCLESVFGVAFSVLFYNERLSARMVAGFAAIFVSIIVSETRLSFLRPRADGGEKP